jgi:hypothetical protein
VNGIRKAITYAIAALAALSSLIGIIGWLFPTSAGWVTRHGAIAWTVAAIFFFLFTGTFTNLLDKRTELQQKNLELSKVQMNLREENIQQTRIQQRFEEQRERTEQVEANLKKANAELTALHSKAKEVVKQDRDLFTQFKNELPRDDMSLVWLRQNPDSTIYHYSQRRPLWEFCVKWKSADYHFVNEELDEAAAQLISALDDFLTYQGLKAEEIPVPAGWDRRFRVVDRSSDDYTEQGERETQKGLAHRADKILAAYDALYTAGGRMGM